METAEEGHGYKQLAWIIQSLYTAWQRQQKVLLEWLN